MPGVRDVVDFIKETVHEVMDDDVPALSASIAYFAILSLPALLAAVVSLAGLFFDDADVQNIMTGQAADILGSDGASQLAAMIEQAREAGGGGIGGQLIAYAALFFGATGAFGQLQQSLNRAWDVGPDPEASGVKQFVWKRVLSLGMVLTIAFLLAVSLVLSAAIEVVGDQLGEIVGGGGTIVVRVANVLLPLALFTALFASMFKVLPDAEIQWRDVWVGGFATAILFVLGKFLIGLYLAHSDVGAAFGAAGSLVVVLVWIYYTALLVLVGAEFTQVWARRYGHRILPEEGAVRVVRETRQTRREDVQKEQERAEAQSVPSSAPKESAGGHQSDDSEQRTGHPHIDGREAQPRTGINPEPPKS
jgi:membrane protein